MLARAFRTGVEPARDALVPAPDAYPNRLYRMKIDEVTWRIAPPGSARPAAIGPQEPTHPASVHAQRRGSRRRFFD